jgi:hypothetical protein
MNLWIIQHITSEDPTHIYSISVTQILRKRLKTVPFGPVKYAASKPAGPAVAIFV